MGEALGPNLQLDYNVMDMGDIFMGSSNCYQVRNSSQSSFLTIAELNFSLVQVQLANKGLLDAPFRLSRPASRFGGCFCVSPDEGVVPSGRVHTLQVSFTSHVCGSFSEQLLLTVEGNPEVAAVTFR